MGRQGGWTGLLSGPWQVMGLGGVGTGDGRPQGVCPRASCLRVHAHMPVCVHTRVGSSGGDSVLQRDQVPMAIAQVGKWTLGLRPQGSCYPLRPGDSRLGSEPCACPAGTNRTKDLRTAGQHLCLRGAGLGQTLSWLRVPGQRGALCRHAVQARPPTGQGADYGPLLPGHASGQPGPPGTPASLAWPISQLAPCDFLFQLPCNVGPPGSVLLTRLGHKSHRGASIAASVAPLGECSRRPPRALPPSAPCGRSRSSPLLPWAPGPSAPPPQGKGAAAVTPQRR